MNLDHSRYFHLNATLVACWQLSKVGIYGSGVVDMCEAIEMMEEGFKAVADDGDNFLDEAFMMGINEPLMERLPPVKKYMKHH